MVWIIANWKDKTTAQPIAQWLEIVGSQISPQPNLKVVVCPDRDSLEEVKAIIKSKDYPILVGMQDLPILNKDIAELAILGHSSRRQTGETDEMVAQKVEQALHSGITPLVCAQDENTPIPDGVKLVAYEPVFAIGTGTPDTPENAQAVAEKLSAGFKDLEILYGGSVNSENVAKFIQGSISGVLVGGSSLDATEFVRILNRCQPSQV